jgi:hypothetical protein
MQALKIMREFSRPLVDRNIEKREKVGSARPFSTTCKMLQGFSNGLQDLCVVVEAARSQAKKTVYFINRYRQEFVLILILPRV